MARFIVTGGAGFLGSHLVERLIQEGHHVLCLDNEVTGRASNLYSVKREPRFEWVSCDVSEAFPDVGAVDGVWHLACPASPVDFVPLAIPILKVGSLGTMHALDYAKAKGGWFFLASTSETYGDPLIHPQREDYLGNVNQIGIRGVYDESKRFSEALTMAYHRSFQMPTSIVRIFNTYGPRMRLDDGRVIPNFMKQAIEGKPLTVFGDGSQTRSLCYVSDLIEGIFRFWKYKPIEPINLGNNEEVTMLGLAQKVIDVLGSTSTIAFEPLPADDPKQRCPVIERAKEKLHWEPKISLKEGLKLTAEYFRTASKHSA